MTLLTRDQADVIEAVVAFHLHAGVDFVIAMDHRSADGTTEILESYERDGVLRLIREEGDEPRTRPWRTRMARLAAEDHGADWVIGCDGDEFWWPRGCTLKEALSAVPVQFGVVEAPWRHFLPRPEGPSFFAERMIVRVSPSAALFDPLSPFRPNVKIAHRADPTVVVQGGNHGLLTGPLSVLTGWHPIEVLHFPLRTREQHTRKVEQWKRGGREAFSKLTRSKAACLFDSLLIGEDRLELGLERGALTLDTRLRDALRTMELPARSGVDGRPRRYGPPPAGGSGIAFPASTVADEKAYANDLAAIAYKSALRRELHLDDLEARIFTREGARW